MGVTPSQALTCDDSKPTLFDLDVFDLDRDAFSARFSHYAGCAKEQSMRDVHVLSPTHTLSPTPVSPTAVHLTVRALSRVGKVKPAWQAIARGLNVRATCSSRRCFLRQHVRPGATQPMCFYTKLGFGVLDLRAALASMKCSACSATQVISNLDHVALVLYGCTATLLSRDNSFEIREIPTPEAKSSHRAKPKSSDRAKTNSSDRAETKSSDMPELKSSDRAEIKSSHGPVEGTSDRKAGEFTHAVTSSFFHKTAEEKFASTVRRQRCVSSRQKTPGFRSSPALPPVPEREEEIMISVKTIEHAPLRHHAAPLGMSVFAPDTAVQYTEVPLTEDWLAGLVHVSPFSQRSFF